MDSLALCLQPPFGFSFHWNNKQGALRTSIQTAGLRCLHYPVSAIGALCDIIKGQNFKLMKFSPTLKSGASKKLELLTFLISGAFVWQARGQVLFLLLDNISEAEYLHKCFRSHCGGIFTEKELQSPMMNVQHEVKANRRIKGSVVQSQTARNESGPRLDFFFFSSPSPLLFDPDTHLFQLLEVFLFKLVPFHLHD